MSDIASLPELLKTSDSDLLIELWRQASPDFHRQRQEARRAFLDAAADRGLMFNLRFPDDEDEGKWLFRNLEPKLRQALCVHWETCQKLNKGKYENEGELAAVLCDILSTALTGVPITILSVLMVKIGLKRFCKCE